MARRLLSVTRLAVLQRRCLCTQQVNVSVKDDRVQELLTTLTGMDFDLVFAPRHEPLTVPHYKLMTLKQLKEVQLKAKQTAKRLLKMPPVLPVRSPKDEVLERDEKLEGATEHTMIFTDTTHHKLNRHRRIVARERDGTLREATWEERDRMCQLFFPVLGRTMTLPDMLTPEELPEVLQRKSTTVLNILDCVGVQCEPDSEHYARVHSTVYEHIDSNGLYEELKFTKYYSCLVWHLLLNNRINGLLTDMVKRECLSDAAMLIKLYLLCYPHCELTTSLDEVRPQGTELVKMYCQQVGLTELEKLLTDNSELLSNSHMSQ